MGEKTGIAWCDHSFNPWIGCTRVSVEASGGGGCDHCYAEAMDARRRWDGGRTHWGAGVPRKRTSEANWQEPVKWNRKAIVASARRLVFCASLADVFDNEVPAEWRDDLFKLIEATPALTWLLLTKRIGNAMRYLPMPHFENVWLGASVVNQEEADRDIPKLLATPAAKRFVSYEPALGPIEMRVYLDKGERFGMRQQTPTLDWVIVGGESSQGSARARPFDLAWARSTVAQCKAAGVPVFVKQLGGAPLDSDNHLPVVSLKDRAGSDPAEWPEDLRVQELPK